MAVESTGNAKAEAESRAEAARIEGEGSVLQAKLKAEALAIETVSAGARPGIGPGEACLLRAESEWSDKALRFARSSVQQQST